MGIISLIHHDSNEVSTFSKDGTSEKNVAKNQEPTTNRDEISFGLLTLLGKILGEHDYWIVIKMPL